MSPTDKQQLQKGTVVLADDHEEVGKLINLLLASLHEGDKARSFERLDLLWARLAVHIRAEHLCLFPSILGASGKSTSISSTGAPPYEPVREVLERLRADHDFFMVELAKAVNAARELFGLGDKPSAAQFEEIKGRVQAVGDRLAEHNLLEEEQVYRWSELLLSPGERSEMSARMKREIGNLPPRFSTSKVR